MKVDRFLLRLAGAVLFLLFSCERQVFPENPQEPDRPQPEEVKPRPVLLWIDASANFQRLRYRKDIRRYLDIAQEAGFNGICLDVKPIKGHALYRSAFLPPCESLGGCTVRRDWDYLAVFIEEAKKRGLSVTVSVTVMTWGSNGDRTGPAFEDPVLQGAAVVEYLPQGLVSAKDDPEVFCFMNPLHPEVRRYIRDMVTELVSNYDFDGFILDYCRYPGLNADFSELTRQEFEKYTGLPCPARDWPQSVYSYPAGETRRGEFRPGPRFNEWIEFRSHVIREAVVEISGLIRSIKPEMPVQLWGAPWWPLWATGQNWASARTDRTYGTYWWATPNYYRTGFADQIDVFQVGAYGNTIESITQDILTAQAVTDGDCKVYGTISAANGSGFPMADACECCLKESDGLMVFELSHILRNKFWDEIKAGVEKAEIELGIRKPETPEKP